MNEKNYEIRREKVQDYRQTEELTREAFWNVYRPGCYEHYLLHCFREREEFVPELDLVMEIDGKIMGHIMYTRAWIQADDGRRIPVLTFGPVSIHPNYQRRGYGKALVDESLELAKKLGAKAVCIEGNPAFYEKSGFVNARSMGIYPDGQPREQDAPYFLVKELCPGFLGTFTGVYETPEGYFVKDEDVEAFDSTFPVKEK